MNRDEYLTMLDTAPATDPQIGAIIGEFGRLGITVRAERLAVSAALLGLDDLSSTGDLVMGQAGMLIRMLRDTPGRAALLEMTRAARRDARHQGDGDGRGQDSGQCPDSRGGGRRVTIAAAIRDLIAAMVITYGPDWPAVLPRTAAASPEPAGPEPPPDRASPDADGPAATRTAKTT